MTRTDHLTLWLLRAAWVTLPVTVGAVLDETMAGWDTPVRVIGEGLLWITWGTVLVASLAPRPVGLTAIRILVPAATAVVAAAGFGVGGMTGWAAVVVIVITFTLALTPAVTMAAINGPAYGDERRYALRIPPVLFVGPLPLAVGLAGGGIVTGPLLLAGRQWVVGIAAVLAGIPIALAAARALHGLSRRWAVLVPAGFVLADPARILEPVLFRRERVLEMRQLPPRVRPRSDELDLRMGAQRGAVALTLDEETDMLQVRTGRRRSEQVPTRVVWFALVRRDDFLTAAGTRRLRVVLGEQD